MSMLRLHFKSDSLRRVRHLSTTSPPGLESRVAEPTISSVIICLFGFPQGLAGLSFSLEEISLKVESSLSPRRLMGLLSIKNPIYEARKFHISHTAIFSPICPLGKGR